MKADLLAMLFAMLLARACEPREDVRCFVNSVTRVRRGTRLARLWATFLPTPARPL